MQVLVVKTMQLPQPAPGEKQAVELKGTLRYFGNREIILADGTVGGGSPNRFAWEGYHLQVNGELYRLEFADGKNPNLDALVGKTVSVNGSLQSRLELQTPAHCLAQHDYVTVKSYHAG
jgi:hypothetical protein